MIEKVVNYLKKSARWRRYGRKLSAFRGLEDYERFLSSHGLCPSIDGWRKLSAHNRQEAALILETYGIEVHRKRVLDIGPGLWDFLDVARQRGAETVGLDYDPFVVRFLQLRGHLAFTTNVLKGNWGMGNNLFDFVHLKGSIVAEYFDLVGHGRLRRFLKNIDNLTAPGGRILLCPFYEYTGTPRRLKSPDPRKSPFTATLQQAGFEIMETVPMRNEEVPYPLTYGKTVSV